MLKTRVTVELDIFEIGVICGLLTHLEAQDSIQIHLRHRLNEIITGLYKADQEATRAENARMAAADEAHARGEPA
jgi:hypothetical protein